MQMLKKELGNNSSLSMVLSVAAQIAPDNISKPNTQLQENI